MSALPTARVLTAYVVLTSALTTSGRCGDAPAPIVTKTEKPVGAKDDKSKQDEQGMSRLLKAKKRAQEDMKED